MPFFSPLLLDLCGVRQGKLVKTIFLYIRYHWENRTAEGECKDDLLYSWGFSIKIPWSKLLSMRAAGSFHHPYLPLYIPISLLWYVFSIIPYFHPFFPFFLSNIL